MAPSIPQIPLSMVAAAVPGSEVRGESAGLVRDAVCDSRAARAGSLFFCVVGSHTDGHAHAGDALDRGAVALVVERWLDVDATQVRVPSVRHAMGAMSAVVFGHPADAMRMVGVTGTNGKTTTTYLLESIFSANGWTPGLIGTTGARIGDRPLPLARTTPEAPDLHRLLATMRDEDVDAVAMEVSSHALDQHRVDGVRYAVAVFTNLTQDHLDYHQDMASYFDAKTVLFTPRYADRAAVNLDDPHGVKLAASSPVSCTTYGTGPRADVRAEEVVADASGVSFRVGDLRIRSPLLGRFNAWNCLAALTVARCLAIDDEAAVEGIAMLRGVPGRVEKVDEGQDFLVMVDYAHTPDSIHNVLRSARPLATGRLTIVFGCGGDRDRGKRPGMGRVATANADLTVLTSDNPRSEEPLAIIGDIEPGAREGGGAFVIEPDRRAAIRLALHRARPGDAVVIAGKGHEPYQELADGAIRFDDREVAAEELRTLRAVT